MNISSQSVHQNIYKRINGEKIGEYNRGKRAIKYEEKIRLGKEKIIQ